MSRIQVDPDFVLVEYSNRPPELYVCNPQFLGSPRLSDALTSAGLHDIAEWLRHVAKALSDTDRPTRVCLEPSAAEVDVWVSPGRTWLEIRCNLIAAAEAGAR